MIEHEIVLGGLKAILDFEAMPLDRIRVSLLVPSGREMEVVGGLRFGKCRRLA
jgi:hypothetical protein